MSSDPRQIRRQVAHIWSALRLTDRARLSKRRRAFLDLLDSDPEAAEAKREEFFRLLETAKKRSPSVMTAGLARHPDGSPSF